MLSCLCARAQTQTHTPQVPVGQVLVEELRHHVREQAVVRLPIEGRLSHHMGAIRLALVRQVAAAAGLVHG